MVKKLKQNPPPEIYSLINILKNIPLVKQYTDSLQSEQTHKKEQKGLTPEFVQMIEQEILGINHFQLMMNFKLYSIINCFNALYTASVHFFLSICI